MFKYQASNPKTFQVITRIFPTKEEAEDFAIVNSDDFPEYHIIPAFIDGQIIGEDSYEDEYDEDAELDAMGLKDEETSEGFDWTLEDKNGD